MPGYWGRAGPSRDTGGYQHVDWAIPSGHCSPAREGVLSGEAGEPQLRGAPPAVP